MANTETKKVTKKEMFSMILAVKEVAENEKMVEFLNHEIELLDKKNGTNRKPTANQLENIEISKAVVEILSANPNKLYTATQVAKEVEPVIGKEISNQRMSAILRSLGEEKGTGEVKKIVDKRVSYFQINA